MHLPGPPGPRNKVGSDLFHCICSCFRRYTVAQDDEAAAFPKENHQRSEWAGPQRPRPQAAHSWAQALGYEAAKRAPIPGPFWLASRPATAATGSQVRGLFLVEVVGVEKWSGIFPSYRQ